MEPSEPLVKDPERTSEEFSQEGEDPGEYFVEADTFDREGSLEELSALEKEQEDTESFYNTNDFISKPFLSTACTLSENIVEFDYSFGYDCQRLFNLCIVDSTVLAFASGNLIHFLDTSSERKWFRRCSSGCGIGHLAKNSKQPHLAVGEKGEYPLVIIYEWPSFDIVTILRGGTKTAFAFLDYSPDGELLCTQGRHPDYALTIWDWRKRRIVLRSKACGQTVFNSRFSLFTPGQLTSSGIGHIKFWKISRTFTGLKLLGESGRFGKSEICNVIGFLALPDEKVVSSCEWGNILVWDEGLIRVEVCRAGRRHCHEAPITQFLYDNGELTTVAMDGTIKIWPYESVELADPPEEDKFVELEPVFEYKIGDYYHEAKLMVIVETNPINSEIPFWYGQDANGGIWKLDLSRSSKAKPPGLIFQCHAGAVAAVQCSPFSTHLATLGEDGKLFIHDYVQKQIILKKEFLAGGRSLLWLPLAVEESGCVLVGGFADGVVRVLCVSLPEFARKLPSPTGEYINLIQVSKPHTKAITVITINPKRTFLVTGSEDATIFVYRLQKDYEFAALMPLGYVPVPGEVSHCTWKPKKEATILVSCKNGKFVEVEIPLRAPIEEPISYFLEDVNVRKQKFASIKSEIQRNLKWEEIQAQKLAIIEDKKEELLAKREAKTLTIDDELILEMFREDLEAEEPDLPELYIPEIPSPVLFATYVEDIIWLSMGGYDAGYMYEYNFNADGLVRYKEIPDAADVEISCYHYYYDDAYLVLGLKDGKIRVVKLNSADRTDLSDYWSLSMHDNDTGPVRQICFDYNYSHMFTCGNDGNIFSYKFHPENNEYKNVNVEVVSKGFPFKITSDIDDASALSLEQTQNEIERTKKLNEADSYKKNLLDDLRELEKRYETVIRRNSKLPTSQQLKSEELILDPRIVEEREKYLEEKRRLAKLKIAWQCEKNKVQHDKIERYFLGSVETHVLKVFAINRKKTYAKTFRLESLGPKFEKAKEFISNQLEELEAKVRVPVLRFPDADTAVTTEEASLETPVDEIMKQIADLCIDFKRCTKLRRLLKKYSERKDQLKTRRSEWKEMMKNKPSPDEPDPEDLGAIEMAKNTIGDCRLKTDPDYNTFSEQPKETSVCIYAELLKTREKIYKTKQSYNENVLRLRQQKQDMIDRHEHLREILLEIQKEIPKDKIRYPPSLPIFIKNIEFPEKKFALDEIGTLKELPKKFRTGLKLEENAKKKEIKPLNQEYELSILDKKIPKPQKNHSKVALMKQWGITGSKNFEELQEAGADDDVATPWEKELKASRVIKRLYEQDEIVDQMENDAKNFDEEITRLKESKYQTEIDIQFLKLHLLTLHQVVLVLKKFESAEEKKLEELSEVATQTQEIRDKINETDAKIEESRRIVRTCREEIKNVIITFHEAASKNPFYYFLKEIFNKKYKKVVEKKSHKKAQSDSEVEGEQQQSPQKKPPEEEEEEEDEEEEKESSSEDSSEESSSSSSTSFLEEAGKDGEGEDVKSVDSKQLDPFIWDENICPPGCDRGLYEWTLSQRSTRHELQLKKKEEKKQTSIFEKEHETLSDKIAPLESRRLKCKNSLDELSREKHRSVQELETTVVLRPCQIQSFKTENEMENLSDSVLFSSSMLSKLYKRVDELEHETQVAKEKHEKNRHHFARIKIDVEHMKKTKEKLRFDLDEATIKKFGTKVDIDEVREALLERLVAEMHGTIQDLEKELESKLAKVRQLLIQKENEHAKKTQDNTYRYNLLTVLQEQKMIIQETVRRQDNIELVKMKAKEHEQTDKNEEAGLEKLRKIKKMQNERIAEMRRELAALKLKIEFKPPPIKDQGEMGSALKVKTFDKGICEAEKDEIIEWRQCLGDTEKQVFEAREDAVEQTKSITEDVSLLLPDQFKPKVIRRLSKGVIKEESLSKSCAEGVLMEIVKTLKTESFLEASQIAMEIVDSVILKLEIVKYNNLQ